MINLKNEKVLKERIDFFEERERCFSQAASCWALLGGVTLSSSLFESAHNDATAAFALFGVGVVCSACAYIARKESYKASKELIELDAELSKVLIKKALKSENDLEK